MERERLKDLCANALSDICQITPILSKEECNKLGDFIGNYLADNGVIYPPCKVGDTVYILDRFCIGDVGDCPYKPCTECEDYRLEICERRFLLDMIDNFGKTVFLTHEEAETELKRMETNE